MPSRKRPGKSRVSSRMPARDVGRVVLPDVEDAGGDGQRAARLQIRPRLLERRAPTEPQRPVAELLELRYDAGAAWLRLRQIPIRPRSIQAGWQAGRRAAAPNPGTSRRRRPRSARASAAGCTGPARRRERAGRSSTGPPAGSRSDRIAPPPHAGDQSRAPADHEHDVPYAHRGRRVPRSTAGVATHMRSDLSASSPRTRPARRARTGSGSSGLAWIASSRGRSGCCAPRRRPGPRRR